MSIFGQEFLIKNFQNKSIAIEHGNIVSYKFLELSNSRIPRFAFLDEIQSDIKSIEDIPFCRVSIGGKFATCFSCENKISTKQLRIQIPSIFQQLQDIPPQPITTQFCIDCIPRIFECIKLKTQKKRYFFPTIIQEYSNFISNQNQNQIQLNSKPKLFFFKELEQNMTDQMKKSLIKDNHIFDLIIYY